jgi:DNA-binding NarL/FixJ family response regulator
MAFSQPKRGAMNATRWQLPYEEAGLGLDAKKATEPVAAQGTARRLRILVAHEQHLIRRGVRELLQDYRGWEICGEARTGWEAFVEAEKLNPDVAILNLKIPQLNGLEAAKRIRKASPRTEILIMSSHFADELIPDIVEAGARGYLYQGTDAEQDLVTAVESLASHKPFFTARALRLLLLTLNRTRSNQGRLSLRERDVLRLTSRGNRTVQVASDLGITKKTVDTHRANIMRKLELHSLADLVRYAIRNQVIEA